MNDRLAVARYLIGLLVGLARTPTRIVEFTEELFAWARTPRFFAYNQPPGGYGGPPGGGGYGGPPQGGGYGGPPGGGYGGPPQGGGYGGPPPGGGYGSPPQGYGQPGYGPTGPVNYGQPPGVGAPPQNTAGPAPSSSLRILGGVLTIGTSAIVLIAGGIITLFGLLFSAGAKMVDKAACEGADKELTKACKDLHDGVGQAGDMGMLIGGSTIAFSLVGILMGAFCIAGKPWAAIGGGVVMALLSGLGVWSCFGSEGFNFHWYVVVEVAACVLCFLAYSQCKQHQAWKAAGGR